MFGVASLNVVQHGFGGANEVGHLQEGGVALGVRDDGGAGVVSLELQHRLGLHGVVHGAYSVPEQHLTAGHLVDVAAQVLVRREDDFLLLGQRTHQLLGVARGTDKVAEGLNLGRAVDITDDHVVGVLGLEGGEVVAFATLGQGARGLHVGQQYLAARVEDFGRLGHEMDATEDDDVGLGALGFLRQCQAIAHIVGELLYFVPLVVMPQDDGVFLFLQSQDFLLQLLVSHICYDILFI